MKESNSFGKQEPNKIFSKIENSRLYFIGDKYFMVNYRNYGFSVTDIPGESREGGECINHIFGYFSDSQRTGYRGAITEVSKISYLLKATALISINNKKFSSNTKELPEIPDKLCKEDEALLDEFCETLAELILDKEYSGQREIDHYREKAKGSKYELNLDRVFIQYDKYTLYSKDGLFYAKIGDDVESIPEEFLSFLKPENELSDIIITTLLFNLSYKLEGFRDNRTDYDNLYYLGYNKRRSEYYNQSRRK